MRDDREGPDVVEMTEIIGRLRQDVSDASQPDELLQVEMTLRGMMPDLETHLQQKMNECAGQPGEDAAIRELMHLSGVLMWIQMHAQEPPGKTRKHLDEALDCAEQVLCYMRV